MSKKTKTGGKRVRYTRSISFQNSITNLLIFVVFISFAIYTILSMVQIKNSAEVYLDLSSETLITLGDMKSDVSTAVVDIADLAATVRSESTADSIKRRAASNTRLEIDSLYGKVEKRGDYLLNNGLWEMFPAGKTAVSEAMNGVNTYYADVYKILDNVEGGNYKEAIRIIDNEYASDKSAATRLISVMEDDVIIVVNRVSPALEQQLNSVRSIALVLTACVVVFIAISTIFTNVAVSSKIKAITRQMGEIVEEIDQGHGDLSKRLKVKTSNECSLIVEGFNSFMDTLQGIIGKVKEGTVVLEKSSSNVSDRISAVSNNIMSTSAAMEELTATMETVSGVTKSLDAKLEDVNHASQEIRENARAGSDTAVDIQSSASAIKAETESRKEDAIKKVEELSVILQKSVKDSEQVSQINDLTATIMDIASQTNLLSLNASIEAARAGETGKGFAVVAQEIGTLAANSHVTAENIQEISKEVTNAVKTLSENATQVIEFINESIIPDYDSFGKIGDDYMETAHTISEMVGSFTEKADMLSETMEYMTTDIGSITESINESTKAISMSAENTQEIVGEISEISNAVEDNTNVSGDLTASVAMFIEESEESQEG